MTDSTRAQIAALGAMALALVVALVDRGPTPTAVDAAVSTTPSWAAAIEHEDDHIAPAELAERMMADPATVLVIDLRPAEEFRAGFRLPGAVNLDLPRLLGAEGAALLAGHREGLVVLCSNGMTHPGQAWVELARRPRTNATVKVLADGLDGFIREILTPPSLRPATTEARANAETARFKAAQAFFLGAAGAVGSGSTAVPPPPYALLASDPPSLSLPTVVSTAWVERRGAEVVVVDTRDRAEDYAAGHIPGAIHVPTNSLREERSGVPNELLPPEQLAAKLGALGIGPQSEVVAYGDDKLYDPTHLALALLRVGHERVAVLEGGWSAWKAEGRAVSTEMAKRPPVPYAPRPAPSFVAAELEQVRRASTDAADPTAILDVRPGDAFRGEVASGSRLGHIPRAISRPFTADLARTPSGVYWRSLDALRREYAAMGFAADRPVIVSCRTGHQASQAYFTLRVLLGYTDVRWYDGSWMEWSAHPELPAVMGPTPPSGK